MFMNKNVWISYDNICGFRLKYLSSANIWLRVFRESCIEDGVVSITMITRGYETANRLGWNICNENSNGPRTDAWGTPEVQGREKEKEFLIFTNCEFVIGLRGETVAIRVSCQRCKSRWKNVGKFGVLNGIKSCRKIKPSHDCDWIRIHGIQQIFR